MESILDILFFVNYCRDGIAFHSEHKFWVAISVFSQPSYTTVALFWILQVQIGKKIEFRE